MTLSNTLASWREALLTGLRRLAIALAVALVSALAVGASWLMHRPVGYSGDAHTSSLISPDFASGFDVAWEVTASDLGVSGSLLTYVKVDGFIVAVFGEKDQPSTLVGLDLSGEKPSVLWRREVPDVDSPMFAWEDSVVVAGQTIRVADGEVTATWDTPIPTYISSYFDDFNKKAFINVGGDEVNPADGDFLRVTSPVIVICYPRDKPNAVQDFDYLCLGWNKDGTEAWRYKVNLSPDDLQGPGLPLPVTAVDGYVPISRNFGYADQQVGAFLHLADHGSGVADITIQRRADLLLALVEGVVERLRGVGEVVRGQTGVGHVEALPAHALREDQVRVVRGLDGARRAGGGLVASGARVAVGAGAEDADGDSQADCGEGTGGAVFLHGKTP